MTDAESIAITKYDLYYESRMTKVECAVESLKNDVREIKIDLRWLLGLMISFSVIMIGVMSKGFHWL